MTTAGASERKRQAERELGVTAIGRRAAAALTLLFLATVGSVPLAEEWLRFRSVRAGDDPGPLALLELPAALAAAARTLIEEGPVASDLRLLESLERVEDRLEDESFLRAWLLPKVQRGLLEWVGLGNEQVYPGRDGWLFYRADLDHVTGPGFLEPRVLAARSRGGKAWEAPPQPDPLVALLDLRRDLGARGIELIVMPTPVKPTVEPERFSRRAAGSDRGAMRNVSHDDFLERLRSAGITLFDPLPALSSPAEGGGPFYLRTDTHWTPGAMERVARALATDLTARFDLGPESAIYHDRPVAVEHGGDLTAMLRLPESQRLVGRERVTIRTVIDSLGASWRPSPGARILVLGDSFTNVFSDARLGWGVGGGLAERLSFLLRRPVDRIALDAGGAHASREALARDLAGGRDRLAGKVVVVYQFAERELSSGDWRRVAFPAPTG